jgi:beta-xylosidase
VRKVHEEFFFKVYDYVSAVINVKTYSGMTEEKKIKLIEKATIMTCKAFAPRRNYDISKQEIREAVYAILETERELLSNEES